MKKFSKREISFHPPLVTYDRPTKAQGSLGLSLVTSKLQFSNLCRPENSQVLTDGAPTGGAHLGGLEIAPNLRHWLRCPC